VPKLSPLITSVARAKQSVPSSTPVACLWQAASVSAILRYCCGGWLAGPICVPIISPEIMISTRRFCCRPVAVSLLATGSDFPCPTAVIEVGSIPWFMRYARTEVARFSESV
jgi:hypothetical protein